MLADYARGFFVQREYSETLGNVVVVKFVGEERPALQTTLLLLLLLL